MSLSSFYSSLLSASSTDPAVQTSFLGNHSSLLDPDQAALCEGLLTSECFTALHGMAERKAPGLDGLAIKFYLKFWNVLGNDLVAVLHSCFASGCLSLSKRRGIICLTFKKGDRLDPRNWRPVTLLNVDYKLASRLIAGHLLKVIHLVVDKDQTCGVPGRFIGENVALLRDVIDYASSSDIPIAILSLDQEKAFDRVDWSFMRSVLSAMGFGPSFISWVDLFHCCVQSSVNVNGYLSPFCSLSWGVRKVVLCLHCCIFLCLRFLRLTFVETLVFVVFAFQALPLCHPFLSMPMICPSSLHRMILFLPFLRRILFLRKHLVLN